MTARGFSLLELLVALTICALVSGAVAAMVPASRAAFEQAPAALDLQQRGRTGVDVLSQALRAAGQDVPAAHGIGAIGAIVPAVLPLDPGEHGFTRLLVIAPRAHAAQGVLAANQFGPAGALAFAEASCPRAAEACGFTRNATAVIADGSGRFDLFTVNTVNGPAHSVTSRTTFAHAYPEGSVVVEVDAHSFALATQGDGSLALVRETAAGAVQPVIDRVAALSFQPFVMDAAGAPAPLPAGELDDGPWLEGGPEEEYDEDVFRIRRVDVALTLDGAGASSTRTFRFGVFLRNVP